VAGHAPGYAYVMAHRLRQQLPGNYNPSPCRLGSRSFCSRSQKLIPIHNKGYLALLTLKIHIVPDE
jgi:hypothetical protein